MHGALRHEMVLVWWGHITEFIPAPFSSPASQQVRTRQQLQIWHPKTKSPSSLSSEILIGNLAPP
jgi:hypothetical protein